jgi:FlaA1/EpsC-like NDP-sugar epimerase
MAKISVSDIKDLTVEDLLSREQVQPNLDLLSKEHFLKSCNGNRRRWFNWL